MSLVNNTQYSSPSNWQTAGLVIAGCGLAATVLSLTNPQLKWTHPLAVKLIGPSAMATGTIMAIAAHILTKTDETQEAKESQENKIAGVRKGKKEGKEIQMFPQVLEEDSSDGTVSAHFFRTEDNSLRESTYAECHEDGIDGAAALTEGLSLIDILKTSPNLLIRGDLKQADVQDRLNGDTILVDSWFRTEIDFRSIHSSAVVIAGKLLATCPWLLSKEAQAKPSMATLLKAVSEAKADFDETCKKIEETEVPEPHKTGRMTKKLVRPFTLLVEQMGDIRAWELDEINKITQQEKNTMQGHKRQTVLFDQGAVLAIKAQAAQQREQLLTNEIEGFSQAKETYEKALIAAAQEYTAANEE